MQKEISILNFQRFRRYVVANAPLERLHTGMMWAEGRAWFADLGILLLSDIPAEQILLFAKGQPPVVFRQESGNANGNTRDRQGRLVTCESGNRRVVRTELDGRQTVLADSYEGRRLNSLNDIVVRSDDTVWFTDPDYGILGDYIGNKASSELGRCCVFRLDPRSGQLSVATDELEKPNGLAFARDEKILYVADSGATHRPGGPHEIVASTCRTTARLATGEPLP